MGYSNDKPAILDTMPADLASALLEEVGGALFDNWYNNHMDEGQFIADYEIATLSDNKEVKAFFNKHWEVEQGEEYFIEEAE
jgi:hypothetical protein